MRLTKQIKGASLAIAAMAALVLSAGTASAAITANYGPVAGAGVSATLNVATQSIAVIKQNQQAGGPLTFTAGVAWPVGSTVTLAVNGATFNGAPNAVTATTTGTVVIGAGVQQSPTQYQWVVGTASTPTDTVTFNTGGAQVTNLTASTGPVTYTITVNAPAAVGGAVLDGTPATTGAAFNMVSAFAIIPSGAVPLTGFSNATTVTDVAQLVAGVPFVFNVAFPALNTAANVGHFHVGNATSNQAIAAGQALVTIVGDFNGIAAVNTIAGMSGSSAAGALTPGGAGTFTINALKTAATAVNTLAIAGGAGPLFVDPRFVFDGVTQQAPRTFSASGSLLAGGNFVAAAGIIPVTGPIDTIANNGLGFTTDLMGTASANTIVIRDRSAVGGLPAAGGKVILTATVFPTIAAGASAGTAFGPVALATTLPDGGQLVLTPASIAADPNVIAAGGLPIGGAANFTFVVQTPAGSISEKKQVPGVGINAQTTLGGTMF